MIVDGKGNMFEDRRKNKDASKKTRLYKITNNLILKQIKRPKHFA